MIQYIYNTYNTKHLLKRVNQLLNPAFWAGGQDLTQYDSWTAPNLISLRCKHSRLLRVLRVGLIVFDFYE